MKRAALLLLACVLVAQPQDQVADWERQFALAKNTAQGDDLDATLAAYESALKKAEAFGPDDRRLAITLNSFAAFCLRNQKLYGRAEPLFIRALTAYKTIYGPSQAETLKVTKNLAILYLTTDNLAKSENLFQEILAEEKKTLETNDPALAETYLGLAMIHQKRGDTAKAEGAYRNVLHIRKEAYSSEHESYISAFNLVIGMYGAEISALAKRPSTRKEWNLVVLLDRTAGLYADFGDGVAGEQIVRQALFIRENVMGKDSPAVCRGLGDLATMLRKQGRYAEARSSLERALAITEREANLDLTARVWIFEEMARLAEAQRDSAGVDREFDKILSIEKESWGETHPRVVSRLERAIEFMERLGAVQLQQKFEAALAEVNRNRETGATVHRVSVDGAEGATAPRLLKKVEPSYSHEAQQKNYEATVGLALNISADGRAENIKVYECAGHGLDERAINAVRKWRFAPGRKGGEPSVLARPSRFTSGSESARLPSLDRKNSAALDNAFFRNTP